MWLKVTALRQAQGPSLRGAAAGIGRHGTVAAVALPDTRQRLRRGAEHRDRVWDYIRSLKIVVQFDNQFVNDCV